MKHLFGWGAASSSFLGGVGMGVTPLALVSCMVEEVGEVMEAVHRLPQNLWRILADCLALPSGMKR